MQLASTVLLFRNFTNFAKVNTTEINQNDLIAKITIYEKKANFPKWTRKKQTTIKKQISTKKDDHILYL